MTRRKAMAAGVLAAGAPLVSLAAEDRGKGDERSGVFKISLNTSTLRGHKLPITETVEIAAKAGYAGIEPWPDEVEQYLVAGGKLEDLDKRLKDKGLKVTGAIAFFQWIVDDAGQRRQALEDAKRYLEKLAKMSATHVAAPPAGPEEAVEGVDLLAAAARYRDLLVASEAFPVVPAVEVWGFRKKMLNRLGQAVLVALEADHPRACVLPDVYHLYKGGSGLDGVRLLNGKILGGFHLNDYPADPPRETIQDRHRVYPGDGVAPLVKFFRDLRDTGYRGALSIELFNPEYWKQDPLVVAKTALEKTKRVMAEALG
jgi:sugar phosphate isomerase/epimerase